MGYIPTLISEAVGHQIRIMGKPSPAPNKPDDVKKIQVLLKRALGPSAPIFTDGKCDDSMKNAIAEFQRAWGIPDGTVDKNGHTLTHLNRLANPLVLKPITMCHITQGGYTIGYTTCDHGPLPPAGKGYTLHLGFPAETSDIEVTGRPAHDLLSYQHNLGKVLAIFEKLACWGQAVPCQLYLKYKGATISSSNTQNLDKAPVEPIRNPNGIGTAAGFAALGIKDLWYPGEGKAPLLHTAIDGRYYFKFGGKFVTAREMRGFDCTTYVGSVYNLQEGMDYDGEKVARTAGAVQCDMENKTAKEVKDFFKKHSAGSYVMWWFGKDFDNKGNVVTHSGQGGSTKGHVFGVVNGMYHEFTSSTPSQATPNGYKTGNIQERELGNHVWTVRQLPK